MARKEINIFNIAFLDLLSGALAAVLILFIVVPKLTSNEKVSITVDEVSERTSKIRDRYEDLKNSVPDEIYDNHKDKFEALEEEIDLLQKSVGDLRDRVEELEAENAELKDQLSACEMTRDSLSERVIELETVVRNLETENARLDSTVVDLRDKNEELDAEIRELRERVTNAERALAITKRLDIVFVLDCTSSMEDEINDLKANLVGIVRILQRTVESIHIGFVAYRDEGDDFITKPFPITDVEGSGLNRLIEFVNSLEAAGGGDDQEAVDIAMREARDLIWRNEVKQVMVVIGDVSAHNDDIETCYDIATNFRARPTTSKVSSVYANSEDGYAFFFRNIANRGGGEFVRDKGRMMESILISVMD